MGKEKGFYPGIEKQCMDCDNKDSNAFGVFCSALSGLDIKNGKCKSKNCDRIAGKQNLKSEGVKKMIKYPYLEKWMSDKGLSQTEMAKVLGVGRTTVSKLLNGKEEPKKAVIDKVLKATGLPYEVAFSETVIHKG